MDETTEKEMLRLLRGILATVNSISLQMDWQSEQLLEVNTPSFLKDLRTSESIRKDAKVREEQRAKHMDSLVAPDLKHPDKKTLG